MLRTDRLSRDNIEKITETSKRVTDVLVHYPSKGNRQYLRHHHVTVMRLHPTEPFFLHVYISAYLPTVTGTNFYSGKTLQKLIDLLRIEGEARRGAIFLFLLLYFFAPPAVPRLCLCLGRFTGHVEICPYFQIFQVSSCLRPIFGLLRHVHQCAKQTLENILRDRHLIKTMRCIEFGPVLQVPENRPCFPYLRQRLRFFHLARRGALFPVFQQLINFGAAPLTWRSSMLSLTIE